MADDTATVITDELLAKVAAATRCTCTKNRFTYAKTHSVYCARVTSPDALRAILEAAMPALAALLGEETDR